MYISIKVDKPKSTYIHTYICTTCEYRDITLGVGGQNIVCITVKRTWNLKFLQSIQK